MVVLAAVPHLQFEGPDWVSLGLVSSIVGSFLIANSILFEHPRRLVGRYFGRKAGRLNSVREYIFNRVQTNLGFAFLLGGFALQLVGRFGLAAELGKVPLTVPQVAVIVLVAGGLLFSGWWWSIWAFRRYVREYFTENPPNLEGDPAMARELGQLYGIEPCADDTVGAYVDRLEREAGLSVAGRRQGKALPVEP
jgi:hypothetical protein